MAYCTQTQIEGEFKSATFTASSTVTDTDVARFIAETDAYIDGRIGLKYSVPVTGVSSLLILRTIAIHINANRIRKIQAVRTGESDKDQGVSDKEYKAAIKMIDDIVSGKLLLSDADLASSYDGVRSYNYDNDIEPAIDVTTSQW